MKQVKDLRALEFLAEIPEQWQQLCDRLEQSIAQPAEPSTLTVKNVGRKWELVSAYQKTIRRGHLELAKHLAHGMVSMVDERQYMWRRIGTTVCEDIGAANPTLMNWVIALGGLMTPQVMAPVATQVFQLVTELMCNSQRSRVYCAFSIIQNQIREGQAQILDASQGGQHLKIVLGHGLQLLAAQDPVVAWAVKNNWRGEGMVIGQAQAKLYQVHLTQMKHELRPHKLLMGLPDYSYDMHTRVGKATLIRLCGHPEVKKLFSQISPKDKAHVLGWAMFFEDGGQLKDQWLDIDLMYLEQQVVAERHGLSSQDWLEVRLLMSKLLDDGVVNDRRNQVLYEQGY